MMLGGFNNNCGQGYIPGCYYPFYSAAFINPNYQSMPGYVCIDYSNGWNDSYHDQLLRTNIDYVYQQYDRNFSGQLEGQEFFFAFRDLCLRMGMAPPMSYESMWNAVMQCDANFNGRVSKMEMFMVFKRLQGINVGAGMGAYMGTNPLNVGGFNNGW